MDKYGLSHQHEHGSSEENVLSRRAYLVCLRKWSKAVIAGVLLSGLSSCGGSWANRAGGSAWSDRGWVNRGGSWRNGAGPGRSWANRR